MWIREGKGKYIDCSGDTPDIARIESTNISNEQRLAPMGGWGRPGALQVVILKSNENSPNEREEKTAGSERASDPMHNRASRI